MRLSTEFATALVAATFGLAGVLAGGAITYFSNRALQDEEVKHQDALEQRAASSAAALEASRLTELSAETAAMASTGLATRVPRAALRTQLSTQDVAVLLAHLQPGEVDSYNTAQICANRLDTEFAGKPPEGTLPAAVKVLLKVEARCFSTGAKALEMFVDSQRRR